MNINIFPLGAGQEVGRSCILLSFGEERRILLDCGVHMGDTSKARYPNFELLLKHLGVSSLWPTIDACLVSHFHLDHSAALPVLTEDFGYSGPVLTSAPSRAIIPFMLKDYMKTTFESFYAYSQPKIDSCCRKINHVGLGETVEVNGVEITPHYAGHVLGAVMFEIRYRGFSVLYTGDFNSSADRHLSGCQVSLRAPLNVLITESTYAGELRDWKKDRELQFMEQIKKTFDRGGKVLVPVFALGRAQEFFVLIEDIWEKTGWTIPVYFASNLSEKVNLFFKAFADWTNHNVRTQLKHSGKSVFDLRHIRKFETHLLKSPGPMLVIATPGMLNGGTSLEVFRQLAEDPRNNVLIPGYCVKGTIGNEVLSGAKTIRLDGQEISVNIEVSRMSFSAHADNKGIVALIEQVDPESVVFVHGEKQRMEKLAHFLHSNTSRRCYCPPNFEKTIIRAIRTEAVCLALKTSQINGGLAEVEEGLLKLLTESSGTEQSAEFIETCDDCYLTCTDKPEEGEVTR